MTQTPSECNQPTNQQLPDQQLTAKHSSADPKTPENNSANVCQVPKCSLKDSPPGKLLRCFLWLFLGIFLVTTYVVYDAYSFLVTPAERHDRQVLISIKPGATFDRVAWDLRKQGVITDVTRFRLLGRYKESFGAIRAGQFLVHSSWTPIQVLDHLMYGQPYLLKLTIREGLTWWQTARLVEEQGFAHYDDFVAIIHDPEFLRAHGIPFENAEGFLYPNTYLLNKPEQLDLAQAEAIASILVQGFWRNNIAIWKRLPAIPYPADSNFGRRVAKIGRGLPIPPLPESLQQASNATSKPSAHNATALPATDTANATIASNAETIQVLDGTNAARIENALVVNGTANYATLPEGTDQYNATSIEASGNATLNGNGNATEADQEPPPSLSVPPFPKTPANVDPASLQRLIILASLVEKETSVPGERTRVAGVYTNRLAITMRLQCDPTVIYGEGPAFVGPLVRSQLRNANNKYNTYQHYGFPPGPISSVGTAALWAALIPEDHGFFYFVATGIGGGHSFSKNLDDHNKAVFQYRSRIR